MSIGVIAISANWLLEGKFSEKWHRIKDRNNLVLIFLIFIVTHLVWILFSNSFDEGLDDLRRKLPFLALPIVIGTSEKLKPKEFIYVLWMFLLGLIISSGVGFYKFFTENYENYRDLSIFVSHIRLGLFLALGIGISSYLFTITSSAYRFFYILPVLYFLAFIKVLGSGTGYFAGGLALILSLLYIAKVSDKKWAYITSLSIIGLVCILVFSKIFLEYKSLTTPRDGVFNNPPKYTAHKNLYIHHPEIDIYENGYPVYMNYCPVELEESWNQRSSIPIDSLDEKGQLIQGTIIRYMTSKNLKKDAEGISQLTEEDITKIESGISSILPEKSGFEARFQETILEYLMYKNDMNPNGHSLVQRLYYLDAGWHIASQHLIFGVTKGDEENAYLNYYNKVDSPLNPEHRLRAHNQLLSFLVCFGIFGALLIFGSLIYPIIKQPVSFLSLLFITITLIGFFSDDMLNRQAGVTYFALFYCLIYLSGTPLNRNNVITNTID